jgi:uncharacterized membrane protein YeaQ/YmgE (transglycosylase-associated protein family)
MWMQLDPSGVVAWLIVGLLAGWAAGRALGGGARLAGDLIVGGAGAVLGGVVASLKGVPGPPGLVGSTVFAGLGAAVLVAFLRTGAGRRTSA